MSSIPKFITTAQLQVIKTTLLEGGHSDDVWSTSPPNIAAQALIGLVQNGLTDPIDLAREVEMQFGQVSDASPALQRSLEQLADHGLFVKPALDLSSGPRE